MQRIHLVVVFFLSFTAQEAFAWVLDFAIGDVRVESENQESRPAVSGDELKAGEAIVTGMGAIALLTDGASEIRVGENSRLKVTELPEPKRKKIGILDLLQGKLHARIQHTSNGEVYPYEFRANSVVAGVRGTEFFVLNDNVEAKVCTLKGLVRVHSTTNPSEHWDVGGGNFFIKSHDSGKPPVLKPNDPELIKKWTKGTEIKRQNKRIDHRFMRNKSRPSRRH